MRPEQLVEVVVDKAGEIHRGSGYRITSATVLTARHLIEGASRIEVRFDAGLPTADTVGAEAFGEDAESDLALLNIAAADRIEPALLGRVSGTGTVLDVRVAGFPKWKLRGGRFRESAVEPGTAALQANRREGTLQITLAPPADDPEGRSPWEGISGGPVFARECLIAVVSRHHPREGLNRLTATPIARWVDRLAEADRTEVLVALGLDPTGSLPTVTVTPTLAYQTQVHEIAPAKLVGREAELEALAQFCAGSESYAWWQAPPWAGKTALMSSFVVAPPPRVQMVSFFVTGRLAGQADSTAFTDALLDQLAAVLGREIPSTAGPSTREPLRRHWLAEAAQRCVGSGQCLVLVVDGLDEDAGTGPGSEVPSIASLLPARPGPGLKVVVAGRPHPPIPGDVPGGHPLRHCRVIELSPSPFAQDIGREALRELGRHLAAGGLRRDLAGLLAAAGGGLALDDLVELTASARYTVDDVLTGVFGRTVERREGAYLFAHDALQSMAKERLGEAELARYRDRIHEWASGYRTAGWPAQTPGYLLRGYVGLLRELRDLPRLVEASTDRSRHDLMLSRLHADTTALSDIEATQRMLAADAAPDLVALGRLAAHHDFLVHRNLGISPGIPPLWRKLGFPDRAIALAESITHPDRRSQAMKQLALQAIGDGDWDDASDLFRRIPDPDERNAVTVAAIRAANGDPGRTRALLEPELDTIAAMPDADRKPSRLTELAAPLVDAGDRPNLEYLLGRVDAREWQIETLLGVAARCDLPGARMSRQTLAEIGTSIVSGWHPDEQEQARSALRDLHRNEPAPAGSVAAGRTWASDSGDELAPLDDDWDEEDDNWDEEEAEPRAEYPWQTQAISSLRMAEEACETGDGAASDVHLRRAMDLLGGRSAGNDEDLGDRIAGLAAALGGMENIAAIATAARQPVSFNVLCAGLRLAAAADRPAASQDLLDAAVARLDRSWEHAKTLVRAACRAGYAEPVGVVIRQRREWWGELGLTKLATAFADEGAPDQAMMTLLYVETDDARARAAEQIATTYPRGDVFAGALAVAHEIADPDARVQTLVALAQMAAGPDPAIAREAAEEAELTARSVPDSQWQIEVLSELAALTATAGDPPSAGAAVEAVRHLVSGHERPLGHIFDRIGRAATDEDLRQLRLLGPLALIAAKNTDAPDHHGELIARLARAMAADGETTYARLVLPVADWLITSVPGADRRDWALADLVWAAAAVGDFDRAERATGLVGSPDRRADLQIDLVRSLALAGELRRAGLVTAGIAIAGRRADAYLEIVRALNRAGQVEQAVTAARTIASLEARSEGLLLTVQAAARAGELDLARDIALTIPGPDWRAWALECVDATTPDSIRPRLDGVVHPPAQHELVPLECLRLLHRLTRTPSPVPSPRESAEAFIGEGSRPPLVALVHQQPAVVSAVAAETLALMRP